MIGLRSWRFITLMLASLSLSLSMTHLLELPQRMQFEQTLWIEVTVVENVYRLFGSVGSVFEIGAILAAVGLAFLVRKHGPVFYWTLGGALLMALALASWIIFVAPINAELAKWLTNPVPADWTRYRDQWEYAHAANAVIKIMGLGALLVSVLIETPIQRVFYSEAETEAEKPLQPALATPAFHRQSTDGKGELVCPYCRQSFSLTWHRYWAAPFGEHHCPHCHRVSHLEDDSVWVWPLRLAGIGSGGLALFAIAIYSFQSTLIGSIFFLVGIFGVGFLGDKWIDGHLRQLKFPPRDSL